MEQAGPGRRVAVNLRGLERADLDRGAVLAPPGLLQPGRWLDVELRLLATAARPLVGGERLKLLIGTSETAARLRLLDENSLAPGAGAVAQLLAEEPIAAPALERFILRVGSPPRTVGGGRVLIAAVFPLVLCGVQLTYGGQRRDRFRAGRETQHSSAFDEGGEASLLLAAAET